MLVVSFDADTNNWGVTIARRMKRGFRARTLNFEIESVSSPIKNYRGEKISKVEEKRRKQANRKRQRKYNFARTAEILAELSVFRPNVVLVEDNFYAQNAMTAMRLGEMVGPIFVWGYTQGADVFDINVNTVRAFFGVSQKVDDKKAAIRAALPDYLEKGRIKLEGLLSEKTTHETDSLALLVYWKEKLYG